MRRKKKKKHHKAKVQCVVNCRYLLCSSPAALAAFIQGCHCWLLLLSPCETSAHTGRELKVLHSPELPFQGLIQGKWWTESSPFPLSHQLPADRISIPINRGKWPGTAQGMGAAPRLPQLQEDLDNTPGHTVGFLGWPGVRLSGSCGHIPAQEFQWF